MTPRTEAGRMLLDFWNLHRRLVHDVHAEDAVEDDITAIEREAVALAGHRTEDEHDCFLMNCKGMGRELTSLRNELTRRWLLDAADGDRALVAEWDITLPVTP